MELQETRRYILEILRTEEDCTVDEIVEALSERLQRRFTTVTVRHHLERLRAENLINPPAVRRRNAPGRPQYVYSLSPKAFEYFPNNYAGLADGLLAGMKQHLPEGQVNVILDDMADSMAAGAGIGAEADLETRLRRTVDFLNAHGYLAEWEAKEDGYLLTTSNCPYERVVCNHSELCAFDLRLVSSLLGTVPRFMGNLREGDNACQYFIPAEDAPERA
ncbi:MAG: helix-turn-helix transcriptional regulator [Anaerolineales bacterium]